MNADVSEPAAQAQAASIMLIDYRDARMHPQIHTNLMKRLGTDNVAVENLDFGDYVFTSSQLHPGLAKYPTIAIELCTINDLVGKIDSGRFGFQLSGMLEAYDRCILMVCGPINSDAQGYIRMGGPAKVNYERIRSALFSASCHGIIVEHTQSADSDHISAAIASNYAYWNRPYEAHKTFRQVPILVDNAAIGLGAALDPRLAVLMGVPAIGEDRARSLLDTAGSIGSASMMMPEDIAKIKGWGPKLAKAFTDFMWRTN